LTRSPLEPEPERVGAGTHTGPKGRKKASYECCFSYVPLYIQRVAILKTAAGARNERSRARDWRTTNRPEFETAPTMEQKPAPAGHVASGIRHRVLGCRIRVADVRFPKRVDGTSVRASNSEDHLDSAPRDDSDDSTDSLTRELREYVSEETHNTNKQHLDLLFAVSASALTKNTRSPAAKTECEACGGTGEIECPYCNGTGALTVGDVLFCDNTGCKKCVVCRNGSGLVTCDTCRGAGSYATWMNKGR
jgi:hypothetical protein